MSKRTTPSKKRKPVHRYNADELHRFCVDDMVAGVHTNPAVGQNAMAWFAEAIDRIARLRRVSKDQAFLEVRHDATQVAGRPLL